MTVSTPAVKPIFHFIDGKWHESIDVGAFFETLNPADNRPITKVAAGTANDIDLAVRAARRAFDEGPWPRLKGSDRARILRKAGDLILAAENELAYLETLDTGVPIKQTRGQAARAAENFYFFAEMATRLTGHTFPVEGAFHNYSVRHPVGVAGLITPWNTPFMLESWKVAPCLAAGNTCVLKPAEWSPLSARKLAEILVAAGVPKGAFNLVNGLGETAGAALVAHPGVQLISFTGETATGMEIMRHGAATLKRYSMELGGKSPVVVFADADLERALDAVLYGAYSLNGERCTAGSRLLIESGVAREFSEALSKRVAAIKVGDPFDEETELGPLTHPEHWQRVHNYVDLARFEGAAVAVGGKRPQGLSQGNFLEATLFTGVRPEMRVFQEEIFGPVLGVTTFAGEAEALRLANNTRYGLAAYVWTRDLNRATRFSQSIESGMVWVNSQNVRDLRTPFGGMKQSGIGREGGEYSFEFYTELQTIHVAMGEQPIPKFGAK